MAQTEFVESRRTTETTTSITQERTYTVDSQDPWDALGDPDIPLIGNRHPSRTDMFVVERSAETISPALARVTIVYSREYYQTGDVNQEEVEIDIGADQKRVFWEIQQKSNEAPAELIDPVTGEYGVNIYKPLAVLNFIQYKSFFNWLSYAEVTGTINDRLWRNMPARTVRFDGAQGRRIGNEKWMISLRFVYDREGINPHWYKLKEQKTDVEQPDGTTKEVTKWVAELDDEGFPIMVEKFVYPEENFANLFGGL